MAAPDLASELLDLDAIAAFEKQGGQIAPQDKDALQRQGELRDFVRTALANADQRLADFFWAGEDIVNVVRSRAWAVEQLLLLVWKKLVTPSDSVSLVAVGGYGRGELHPHSDVDLLILLADDIGDDLPKDEIEAFVQLLWDAGFYLGHSVRTISECVEEALDDVVTATTTMESRLLAGSRESLANMQKAVAADRIWDSRSYFEAKFQEQLSRHQRYHETAYNLEPNIKEGPGGLRDIQMISWVTRRHFDARTLHGLVQHGFLSGPEHRDLIGGQRFLWRVRYAIHLLAGRAEDRLLFDYQRELASRFGFRDTENNLAVEQFMQLYYRTVMRLERLNESLLQLFQEKLLSDPEAAVSTLDENFQVRNGYLELAHPDVFIDKPAAIMETFYLLARDENLKGVTASTIRSIRDHIYLVNEEFRRDPEVNRYFIELLRQGEGVYTQLRRMNRYGVLAAYIPVFGNIVGRMQYDLFHVYTVDQHTLFTVRNLRRFAYGKYKERFPYCRSVFKRIARPELLYLAAIFHDIAKGRGGDHSELGAIDAADFGELLDLEDADRDMISWLVKHHLLMSQTAQRKDLSDPVNIQDFAEVVGNTRYLDHLYLLTVADIAATDPKLWNNWKNKLIWELYLATGDALRRGLQNPIKRATRERETRASGLSRLMRRGCHAEAVNEVWAELPEYAFWRLSPDQLEWTTGDVPGARRSRGAANRRAARYSRTACPNCWSACPITRACSPQITSVLDEMGLDVMSARILTTRDGRSWDLFQLMDQHGEVINPTWIQTNWFSSDWKRPPPRPSPPSLCKRTMPRRLKHFDSGTRVIRFTEDPDGEGTVMHLECNGTVRDCCRDWPPPYSNRACRFTMPRIATFGETGGRYLPDQQQPVAPPLDSNPSRNSSSRIHRVQPGPGIRGRKFRG